MNSTVAILIKEIQRVAASRPPGYLDDVMSHSKIEGDFIIMEEASYYDLRDKYRNPDDFKDSINMVNRTLSNIKMVKTPLINQFTKNLSGCSGCGNKDVVYETWVKAKQAGEKMKFQFTVVVESESYKTAVASIPDGFEILSGGVKPESKQPAASGITTGGQFARTSTHPTPPAALNG